MWIPTLLIHCRHKSVFKFVTVGCTTSIYPKWPISIFKYKIRHYQLITPFCSPNTGHSGSKTTREKKCYFNLWYIKPVLRRALNFHGSQFYNQLDHRSWSEQTFLKFLWELFQWNNCQLWNGCCVCFPFNLTLIPSVCVSF